MKYSLISDMHTNHPQPKTPYDKLEKIVVVAGDTANGLEGLKFLEKLRHKGHDVLAVDGNHEHYTNLSRRRDIRETSARFRERYPWLREIEGVRFILRNGWYYVTDESLWAGYMNDRKYCATSAKEINALADQDVTYIQQELENCRDIQVKAVVVTHTSPCLDTLNPEYEGHYSNDWYYNPKMGQLMGEFSDVILTWNHGHTHAPADKVVAGVRVICNPRGYPGENPSWEPLVVEI